MAMLTNDSMIRRADNVVGNAISKRESVMLDMDRGRYFGVNEVGNVIWVELEQPVSLDDLCRRVRQRFDIDDETCRRDVLAFLQQLLDQGLIHANTSDTAP